MGVLNSLDNHRWFSTWFLCDDLGRAVCTQIKNRILDYLNAAFSLSHSSPGLSEMTPLITPQQEERPRFNE